MLALPVRVHSYKTETPSKTQHRLVTLNITAAEKETVVAAYKADTTVYKKVRMLDIYNILTGNSSDMQRTVVDRVQAWAQKRFTVSDDILYTSASYIRFKQPSLEQDEEKLEAEDLERHTLHTSMVMVIPNACAVKLTRMDFVKAEPKQGDSIWSDDAAIGDMKNDLLLMAHDFSGHNSMGAMARWLRKYAWWSSIMVDIRRWHDTCVICLQRRAATQGIGLGTVTSERFAIIQVDHAPLPPQISSLTGCAAILTIVCVCTGTLQLVPARSQTARETVFLLLVNWIRVYGIPLGIQSDGHANFVSALMKAALSMFGVRDQMVSAPNQKGTAAKSERANQYVRKIIDIMVANGDATNEDSLRQYCAIAEMQANQLQCIAGHTSYELCFGKTPRTILDLVTHAPGDSGAPPEFAAQDDTEFYKQLSKRCTDLTAWDIELQDERSRDTTLQKDLDYTSGRTTLFRMDVGDTVSHHGKSVTLMRLSGPEEAAVTARIRHADGSELTVRYDTLRPLGIPRPVLQFPCSRPMQKGLFVFFQDEDDGILGATILQSGEEELTVQMHEMNTNRTTWLPLWQRSGQRPKKNKVCPHGSKPLERTITRTQIVTCGQLTKGYFLTQELREALRSTGIEDV